MILENLIFHINSIYLHYIWMESNEMRCKCKYKTPTYNASQQFHSHVARMTAKKCSYKVESNMVDSNMAIEERKYEIEYLIIL